MALVASAGRHCKRGTDLQSRPPHTSAAEGSIVDGAKIQLPRQTAPDTQSGVTAIGRQFENASRTVTRKFHYPEFNIPLKDVSIVEESPRLFCSHPRLGKLKQREGQFCPHFLHAIWTLHFERNENGGPGPCGNYSAANVWFRDGGLDLLCPR